MQIVCVTCDGTATNFAMMEQLGCNFRNISSLQTTFQHPVTKEPIVIFPDPCHMLKLIRNTFGQLNNFIDEDNKIVKWEYLEKLHKMKVRLAA
ncbi:THAP domain-containing protein [Ooceraea biroi]|uniref:THAP domain-containing protein n=1 Tax=Ooceraea biroi TaxID=2015173 RepID=A0A026W0D4_OOCBI|nr:THAP domain-containing protein [Ooceraea biroi]